MKCPHESHVLVAATEDRWTSALREHVAQCASCAAAAAAAPFMQRLAGAEAPRPALPDSASLWIRAQLPTPLAAERVARPVRILQLACYLVLIATSAAWLVAKWNVVAAWLSSFTAASPTAALFLPLLVCSSLGVGLVFHALFEDGD